MTLISEIVGCMIDRARLGLSTTIVKVKSRLGIEGNEQADELARQAAIEPHADDRLVSIGGAFDALNWPAVMLDDVESNSGQQPPRAPHGKLFLLSNLNGALKDAARPRFQPRLTNDTQYVQIWKNAREDLDLTTNLCRRFETYPSRTVGSAPPHGSGISDAPAILSRLACGENKGTSLVRTRGLCHSHAQCVSSP